MIVTARTGASANTLVITRESRASAQPITKHAIRTKSDGKCEDTEDRLRSFTDLSSQENMVHP